MSGQIDRQFRAGEKTYTARLSILALGALQSYYKVSSLDEVDKRLIAFAKSTNIDEMGAMMWAVLRTHHPDIDKDGALRILDDLGLEGAMAVFRDVFAGASPPDEGEKEPAGKGDVRP